MSAPKKVYSSADLAVCDVVSAARDIAHAVAYEAFDAARAAVPSILALSENQDPKARMMLRTIAAAIDAFAVNDAHPSPAVLASAQAIANEVASNRVPISRENAGAVNAHDAIVLARFVLALTPQGAVALYGIDAVSGALDPNASKVHP